MVRVENPRVLPRASQALAVAFACLAALSGCEEAGDSQPMTSQGDLPCDVQDILVEQCGDCHGAEPTYGAPMALLTMEDLMAAGASDDSRSVWEMVLDRINDETNPMPPSGLMESEDRQTLQAWIDAGHPASDEECMAPPPAPMGPQAGPEHLPCEPTHVFQAFGDDAADSPYPLDPSHDNLIQCFVFDSPFAENGQGLAFAPIIDDARVLHHWIIFGTSSDEVTAGTSFDCTNDMPSDANFIAGWAPGAPNQVLPEDVGFAMPDPGDKILLQVHYWNVAGHEDVMDRSGVAVCASDEPVREHTAGVHILGTLDIAIPPRTNEHTVTGHCTPRAEEPVYVLSSSPHMHNLGLRFRGEIFRGGNPDMAETLVELDHWDFNSQGSVPTPTVIYPGDTIQTTCTFRNPSDEMVRFGDRTEDEMCFNFIAAHPLRQLVSPGFGIERGVCFDF